MIVDVEITNRNVTVTFDVAVGPCVADCCFDICAIFPMSPNSQPYA
jgi:hypothetical protein